MILLTLYVGVQKAPKEGISLDTLSDYQQGRVHGNWRPEVCISAVFRPGLGRLTCIATEIDPRASVGSMETARPDTALELFISQVSPEATTYYPGRVVILSLSLVAEVKGLEAKTVSIVVFIC